MKETVDIDCETKAVFWSYDATKRNGSAWFNIRPTTR